MGQLENKFNYAWYGTCGEHDSEGCKPYVFADNLILLKDAVELISTFGSGTSNTLEFFRPLDESGNLETLECGAMYSIVLKTGKSFDLDGLTPAGSDTIKLGESQLPAAISFTCEDVYEPTPTPTPFACIPETSEFTKISVTSNTSMDVQINGSWNTFLGFQIDDLVGLDTSWLVSGPFTNIEVVFPTGTSAFLQLTGFAPKSEGGEFYLQRGMSCFRGAFEIVGIIWQVKLELINGTMPTPPPVVQTPTPVAPVVTPTPVPVVVTPTPVPSTGECCPSSFTSANTDGTAAVSSFMGTWNNATQTLATYQGFESGGRLCIDFSPSGASYNQFATTRMVYLNNVSGSPIGTLKKFLGNSETTFYYVDTNNQCWSGEYTSETNLVLTSLNGSSEFEAESPITYNPSY